MYKNVKYQKAVPETVKKEVGMYAKVYETSCKYVKYNFNWTTVNFWKAKYKVSNPTFKKSGRANSDETLLKKAKDIAINTRAAGGVIIASKLSTIPMR